MIYAIEGIPRAEKITLPTGEEVEINLNRTTQSTDEDEEGQEDIPEEVHCIL